MELIFTHASDHLIVIDKKPTEDVKAAAGATDDKGTEPAAPDWNWDIPDMKKRKESRFDGHDCP